MILTARDRELFVKLCDYGLLTTRQIASQNFPGVAITTVLRRLRKLEQAFYIQRVTGFETFEVAWVAREKVQSVIGEKTIKRHFRRDTLDHDLKLSALRLALEGTGIVGSWMPEHVVRSQIARRHGLRSMKDRIIPDGLMGVKVDGVSESIAIELELNFKNESRYFRTLNDYGTKRSVWAVWYIVENTGLGRHIEKLWRKYNGHRDHTRFFCSVFDEVIRDPLTAPIMGLKTQTTVGKLWPRNSATLAQPHAHAVSNQIIEINPNKNGLNTENDERRLAPAS